MDDLWTTVKDNMNNDLPCRLFCDITELHVSQKSVPISSKGLYSMRCKYEMELLIAARVCATSYLVNR